MKLVVLLSRVPWPLEKGDKLRAYHQLRYLAKHHEVCLICLTDQHIPQKYEQQLTALCSELHILPLSKVSLPWRLSQAVFSDKPFQVHYFYQKNIQRKISRILSEFQPDHIYCQLIRTAEYVKHYHSCAKTIDFMDALSAGLRRRAQSAPWWQKFIVSIEAHRLLNYEHLIFDYFEHHTIISKQDKQLIFHPKQDKIEVVPNGVDGEFFRPQIAEPQYDLVFTGNMSYPPNVDGAKRIALEILPLIRKKLPNTTLLIAGATPSAEIMQLKGPGIEVSGWIDDMRTAYSSAKLFMAPMRIGAGMQNKLLESMAMAMPCITTSLAANALEAHNGEHFLVKETNEELADAAIHLLQQQQQAKAMGQRARDYVMKQHDWSATVHTLNTLFSLK